MKKITGILILSTLLVQCIKKPVFDISPEIVKASVDTNFVVSGIDSLIVRIDFHDGDGDIGLKSGETGVNAYLTDSRTGFALTYKIPYISANNSHEAVSGTVWFTIEPFSINCRPDHIGFDTLSYDIYIVDRAGHESTHMSTQDVIIQCQ